MDKTPEVKLETVTGKTSEKYQAFTKSELVKASNGMLFKLFADVHNGGHCWNIYVWSSTLSQWSLVATEDSIPNIIQVDYISFGSNNWNHDTPPAVIYNFDSMKKFIKDFVSAL